MLEVTSSAVENLKTYLADNNIESAIRISLMQGGWAGPSLGLALDEPKENDEMIKENGITYLINKELFDEAKPINVDFVESAFGSGFSISSKLAACGPSCGTSCG